MTTDDPAQLAERDWAAIRRELSTMPYGGGIHPHSGMVQNGPTLVAWLQALRGRLEETARANEATEKKLAKADRVLDAGRLVFAAFAGPSLALSAAGLGVDRRPDVGDRKALDEAIWLAIRDQGHGGATLDCIAAWIVDNRSGGPVPDQALTTRLGQLVEAGKLTVSRGPSWVKWHLPVPGPHATPAAATAASAAARLVGIITEALTYHGDRGASTHEIVTWVANTHGGALLDVTLVDHHVGIMEEAGEVHTVPGLTPDGHQRWVLGLVEQCDECEGNGVNCFRHRVSARSGQ